MDKKIGKILAVDDNEDILFALKLLLKPHFEAIQTINNPKQIPEFLNNEQYDYFTGDLR